MKATIGNRNVSKQIAKALEVAAERAGISPSELLELAVPTYGLDADGRLEIEVGDHVAVVAIDGDDVRLTWRAPDGRETATVPAAIAEQTAAVARAKEPGEGAAQGRSASSAGASRTCSPRTGSGRSPTGAPGISSTRSRARSAGA